MENLWRVWYRNLAIVMTVVVVVVYICVHAYVSVCWCMWCELHDLINQPQSNSYHGYCWGLSKHQIMQDRSTDLNFKLSFALVCWLRGPKPSPLLWTELIGLKLDEWWSWQGSMASIFWKFYLEIRGVFLLALPDWEGHWHSVGGVHGGPLSCSIQATPTIKHCSLSHTAFQSPCRHSCRWKTWLWLSEPSSVLHLKIQYFCMFLISSKFFQEWNHHEDWRQWYFVCFGTFPRVVHPFRKSTHQWQSCPLYLSLLSVYICVSLIRGDSSYRCKHLTTSLWLVE